MMTISWLWVLVAAAFAVNICGCYSFTNCTPKPIANDPPSPLPYDLRHIFSINGLDPNVSPPVLNTSDNAEELRNATWRVNASRERKKYIWLSTIQSNILQALGLNQTPSVNPMMQKSWDMDRLTTLLNLTRRQQKPEDLFATIRSYHPSCYPPNNTDKYLWEGNGTFHIFYNITAERLLSGASWIVSSAKLRLYKSVVFTVKPPTPVVTSASIPPHRMHQPVPTVLDCGERFRVSVYQYTKPLKKNKRVKNRGRKLIDSQMVAADFIGWVEFDIRLSIKDWLENSTKNLGLDIVVEDSLTNPHNTADFFVTMNCSEEYVHYIDNGSLFFPNETFPTLDLSTVGQVESKATHVSNDVHRRQKRTTDDTCVKVPVYVTMEELGLMDMVVAPHGFLTAVCFDRFPFNNSTGSCTPNAKAPLSVLILDDDSSTIRYSLIPDLIVKSCRQEQRN